ncbi:3' terminal RNA ribose 2'-O-methyltransferase Hen1 [Serinicoccus sediminis]|uniref:3' terminal RNA ribose 2'-O-methyltransferase Hen1 n=1 Tax=Serinicoccus sediminis TaxID=2306021 RepID=UPI0010216835|nr:3' terminal RNA ribose 2'-O-methyltransferase Hen1 [Serinicoccus sediminis]
MLLTLTCVGPASSDLGYLLHKHPDRVQEVELPGGRATVLYPEVSPDRCTVALLLEVDPIAGGQRRGRPAQGAGPATLAAYVNDRPYAASSLLSVALGKAFRTALNGRCDARPDLVDQELELEVRIPALPTRGAREGERGLPLVQRLLEPLGWTVEGSTTPLAGDLVDVDWGEAPYADVRLTGWHRLADALAHLYVLLPVLDDQKHYWVSPDEVDKLLRRGEGWLSAHPDRELITRRYLGVRRRFVDDALERLTELDETVPDPETEADAATPLRQTRVEAVLAVLQECGARRVVDLGCGEGTYLRALLEDPVYLEILGVDVSAAALDRAERRLGLDRLPERQRARITLRQSSVTYRDDVLAGYDAVLLVEVVEHVDPERLPDLEATVFGSARPRHVVVTTPNVEHNPVYGIPKGGRRHPDHRFEWTRAEFAAWVRGVGERHGYAVELRPVGEEHPELGPPTQLALLSRQDES